MTYPACSHGRGIFKKTIFATRSFLAGPSSTLESLVNAFDSALPAHPPNLFPPDEKPSLPLEPLVSVSAPAHSPLPPDEKPSLDSQDVLVAASARSYGAGTFKNTIFATRCLLGHPLPLEPLVGVSASAHSPLSTRREALPRLPGRPWWPPQHALTGPALSRKTIFATRCLLGHPLPLEPLVGVSAPAHSPLPPDEKPSLDSQDVLVAASARSYGAGTFKNTIFATRCLLGHPLPLEPLVGVSASAHSPLPTRREALPRLPGRLGGRLSTLLRGRHFQENNLRYPLPARPPPSPGAAGRRLCPRPFPPSTRREALPRLPGRLGGRLSTLLRGRHFQENNLRYPLPARPPPSPGAAGQRLCPRPFPPSTRREALPRLPGRLGGRLSTLLRGPALSRKQSSLPVACSATPFPWSR